MREDPRIVSAELDIARPGESVRIWPVRDVIEPRVKVEGPGICYPGICGREITTVGEGRTHRLAGMGVVEVSSVNWHDSGGDFVETYLDMSGSYAGMPKERTFKVRWIKPGGKAPSDLDAAATYAKSTGKADTSKLAVTGFCWGGFATWMYAAHNPGLKAAGKTCEVKVYPDAPHGFNADYRSSYRPDDAKDGWARMLAWFKDHGAA